MTGTLIQRGRELEAALQALHGGASSALVVHGEPGVGKTALLEQLRGRAAGCHVVAAPAARSEMEMPFAALHQVCAPLLDRLDRLPAPQRCALSTAFGLTAGTAADRLLLGLAVLRLLEEAAADRPLLCIVDDAQWLDPDSSEVLSFVARRLPDEPIAIVFATRAPSEPLAALPALRVTGLGDEAARALLRSAIGGPLDVLVAERIVAEANGNPRALLDAVSRQTPTQLAGGFGRPGAGAPAGIDAPQPRPLAALPAQTRRLLLIAAADPLGEPMLLWRAAERLGIAPGAADAARGLLAIGARVRFCDPELRTVVYRAALPGELRRTHGALADVTDARNDAARRAWHRALAAETPDEDVAAALADAAAEAGARGGLAARASFLLTAAALTPGAGARQRRVLDAAEAAWQAGDPDAALRALVRAEAGASEPLACARAELLHARVALAAGAGGAARRLLEAARRLEPLALGRARDAYAEALAAAIQRGREGGCTPREVARSAIAAPHAASPRPLDRVLDAMACRLTEGPAADAGKLHRTLAAFARDDVAREPWGAGDWLATHLAGLLWQHDLQRTLAERHVRAARNAGALAALPAALRQYAEVLLRDGELEAAELLAREHDIGTHAALTAAGRGREEPARRLIGEAAQQPQGGGIALIAHAELLLHNGLGRYDEALAGGRRLLELDPAERTPWALQDLVEAAVRAGATDEAVAALLLLEESARASGSDWARGVMARSRALVSDGPVAEGLYREAITRLSGAASRVDLARAHLVYGEWLRRAGRRVDARVELRRARGMLVEMGFEAFAERAMRELRATGETARKRVDETRDDLTPQEAEIARLAREGLSNAEIGARLFISPRTVEWHLRKIFVKLGIASRVSLRDALPDQVALPA